MAESKMSTTSFRISYDGEALASHTMDVRDLAPSLLGLGEVIVEANRILNGKDVAVELHVTPNVHERCFDIGLEVIQQWEIIKRLMGEDDVSTAKTLIEILVLAYGVPKSVLFLINKFKGKKPVNVIVFKDENGNPMYRYQFDGEDDVILDQKQHVLYQNGKIRRSFGKLLKPVVSKTGVETFIAYEEGKKDEGFAISKAEAQKIDFAPPEGDLPEEEASEEPFEANLRVFSPVYDLTAPRWRFWLGEEHHYMDVSDSNIRQFVFDRGGALINDVFRVRIQKVTRDNDDGEPAEHFKVLEVLGFTPAHRQTDMFIAESEEDDEPKRQQIQIEDDS